MADGRSKLPYVDLVNFKGLYTKSSPDVVQAEQLRIAENCDYFETYGAIAKTNGNIRVLASQYQEGGTVKKIPWIGFYKATDLDGSVLRHTLVAAGTILGRIDGSSITILCTGRTENLFYDSTTYDRFMLITNQNPDLVGQGDDLVKYDGAVISNWGLVAPGSKETVREAFDNAASFQTKPASKVTVTDESTITWDGDAIRVDKAAGVERLFYIEKNFSAAFYPVEDARDLSLAPPNRSALFTYIPRGQLTADKISSSSFETSEAAMALWFSPDRDTVMNNYWKFYIPIGQLVEGWNRINVNFSGKPADIAGDWYPEIDRINRWRIEYRLRSVSDTRTGLRLDRFHTLDVGAPLVTSSGTGSLTGDYKYKVTYVSKYAHESNAGPESISHSVSNAAQLNLTNLPVSDDPQVIARQIYRTVAGGSVFLFLDRIENNTQTTYTDTTPDGSLGNATPPQAGDFSDDNSPPPKGGIIKRWKNTIFIAGAPQNPNSLFFSDSDEPESFPLINEFILDEKITAMYETYSNFIVETETGKWQVIGDNPDFSVDKIVDNMGCVGRRAAGETRVVGYAVDRDGMRLFDGNNTLKISEAIRDKYTTLPKQEIELMHTAHFREQNKILQFNPDTTSPIPEYNSIFGYTYSIDDPNQGYWTTIEIPSALDLNIIDTAEVEDSDGNFLLYGSDDRGMVYNLFDQNTKNWVGPTGTQSAIKVKLQTPYLRLGELGEEMLGATGRVDPRYVEIRLRDNTAVTLTVTLESADGPSQINARDSQTLTMEFGTNNSVIRQSINPNFHPGEYIRITVENEQLDTEFEITGIRIYFNVYPFEGQRISVDNSA